jgi:serine/threonine protein kinase
MNATDPHPTEATLEAFLQGRLAGETIELVKRHLETCADCSRRAARAQNLSIAPRAVGAPSRDDAPTPSDSFAHHATRDVAASRPAVSPAAGPTAALMLPDYEIQRELGRGGMGVVYLARNKLMDRLEVVKVLNEAVVDNPKALERFLREIRAAAQLAHPNVVRAFRAARTGKQLALIMEYVEGRDLAEFVRERVRLPIKNACYYAYQAALGLQHAHEQGMVHRDIKPSNLMLSGRGKVHVVKVMDFGLAKASVEKPLDGGLTGEGQMLGTPHYVAPEQTLNAMAADIRADIYSLGCSLYFMLTGAPPFGGNSVYEILHAHQALEPKPLQEARPDAPAQLAVVLARMMAKKPADRYQIPLEAAQALTPFFKPGASPSAAVKPVASVAPSDVAPPELQQEMRNAVMAEPWFDLPQPEPAPGERRETPGADPLSPPSGPKSKKLSRPPAEEPLVSSSLQPLPLPAEDIEGGLERASRDAARQPLPLPAEDFGDEEAAESRRRPNSTRRRRAAEARNSMLWLWLGAAVGALVLLLLILALTGIIRFPGLSGRYADLIVKPTNADVLMNERIG